MSAGPSTARVPVGRPDVCSLNTVFPAAEPVPTATANWVCWEGSSRPFAYGALGEQSVAVIVFISLLVD